jgi:rubrerythrin
LSSKENLKEAFAGESQAHMKYLAFAKKAKEDGYPGIARLFTATAEAELIHAHNHLKALNQIGATAENLSTGESGETYEFETMYPAFVADAQKEGDQTALRTFKYAEAAEKVHAKLYIQAAAELDQKIEHVYYLCPVCGNIEVDQLPDKCPICNVPGSKFIQY